MAEYIEGKRAVLEAFKTNVPATCLYVAEGSHGDKNVSELVKRAHKMGLSVKQVKRDQLDKRSERGSHQGVMLETKPFEYCSAQALINGALAHAGQNNGNALIVVLDHITDAGNLGAIARSAEVVGASGVVVPNKRSAHVNAATYKSSAGAERKGSAMHLGCADGRQARARYGQRRNGPCASYARAVRFPREPSSGRQHRLAQRCAGGHRLHVRMDAPGTRSIAKLIGSSELKEKKTLFDA